jgi:hypothetical protein
MFMKYLSDLRNLKNRYKIGFQFVTGGEPTLWKDNGMDVADVIVALSKEGGIRNITMPTNGKRFEDRDYLDDLLDRITRGVDHSIIIGLSIAGYQENFSDGRCVPLDNLREAIRNKKGTILPVALVTLLKKDTLDEDLRRRYPDIIQRVTPLAPLGAGRELMDECPSLSLGNSNKKDLGAFLPYFRREVVSRFKIEESQFESLPNSTIINRLSLAAHCGNSPFIDDKWHYCLPYRDDPDFNLAPLGGMTPETIDTFLEKRPFLQSIRTRGLIATIEAGKHILSLNTRLKVDKILGDNHPVSVAYRGCMICKELSETGVWREMSATIRHERGNI